MRQANPRASNPDILLYLSHVQLGRSILGLIARSHDRSLDYLFVRWIAHSIAHSIAWTLDRSLATTRHVLGSKDTFWYPKTFCIHDVHLKKYTSMIVFLPQTKRSPSCGFHSSCSGLSKPNSDGFSVCYLASPLTWGRSTWFKVWESE